MMTCCCEVLPVLRSHFGVANRSYKNLQEDSDDEMSAFAVLPSRSLTSSRSVSKKPSNIKKQQDWQVLGVIQSIQGCQAKIRT